MRTFLRTPVATYPTEEYVGLIFDFLDKKLVFAPVCIAKLGKIFKFEKFILFM